MTWPIQYSRRVPARRPEGHQPRAPRWSLGLAEAPSLVTTNYLGVQVEGWDDPALSPVLDIIHSRTPFESNPDAFEVLATTDKRDFLNVVLVGYWMDPSAFEDWWQKSELARWFRDLDPAAMSFGAWREVVQAPWDRLETIYSDPRRRFGLARCPGTEPLPMTTNGYFGAARDRLPISAIDPLHAPEHSWSRPSTLASRGRRLRVEGTHNMAVIRSGQYWEEAEGEQLSDYVDQLQPKLQTGMSYLREHPDETGTLSLRTMTSLDEQSLRGRRETSTLGYFRSLSDLEGWAASHPTHLDIYSHAIRQNRRYGAERTVVTWHEVFVLTSSARFEYVNCHEATGLLARADAVLEVSS